MSDDPKDAFLCHNKADKAWVEKLGERLEAETIDGVPTSRKLSVFFDDWDIDIGESVINRMDQGLKAGRYLAAIMSPEFFKSGWANIEWSHIVAEDPWGFKKKLIPILLRDISLDGSERITLPAPFKILKYLDFRDKSRYEVEFQKLLRRIRGFPPPRGAQIESKYSSQIPQVYQEEVESWLPDKVRDICIANLLEVESFPLTIWSAETEKVTSAEVALDVPEAEGNIIRSKRLWTFADLSEMACRLRKVVNVKSIKSNPSQDWIVDPEKELWWRDLLNKALTSYLSKLAIKKEMKGRFFFRPKDGAARIWKNGHDRARTVAAPKINPLNGSTFWVHHAARIRFIRFAQKYYLMIEPTFLFTSDGEHALGGQQMGRLSIAWGGKQRNPDILRSFIFWAKAIARNKKQLRIQTGGRPIVVTGVPALTQLNVGVEHDHVRIRSLLDAPDIELDQAAEDVEIVEPEDVEEDSHEPDESTPNEE